MYGYLRGTQPVDGSVEQVIRDGQFPKDAVEEVADVQNYNNEFLWWAETSDDGKQYLRIQSLISSMQIAHVIQFIFVSRNVYRKFTERWHIINNNNNNVLSALSAIYSNNLFISYVHSMSFWGGQMARFQNLLHPRSKTPGS